MSVRKAKQRRAPKSRNNSRQTNKNYGEQKRIRALRCFHKAMRKAKGERRKTKGERRKVLFAHLDAVTLIIVVCQIQQLPRKGRPLPVYRLWDARGRGGWRSE